MRNYNNMLYCPYAELCEKGELCERKLTGEVILKAEKLNCPVAKYTSKPICFVKNGK